MSAAKSESVGQQLDANRKRMTAYLDKVAVANRIAGDKSSPDWAGQFQLGLAIAGLELLSWKTDITPRSYWKTAPEPPHNGNDWPISWIVEYGVLNEIGNSYGAE